MLETLIIFVMFTLLVLGCCLLDASEGWWAFVVFILLLFAAVLQDLVTNER